MSERIVNRKLKMKRMTNGRIAWGALLGPATAGSWFMVPHSEMHNARVALTRYKSANPKFDYTTKQVQDGLRVEVVRASQ